ncbi:MAG: 50S ribosomal protein L27 [Candidatus Jorgensenbacteria bacterium]|nr:50S ribosomal protein L27 [Candidatus Jorgensenbacteria bacterium]
MAHTKAKGSTKLGRDSESKRLGVKRFAGATVRAGEVLVRQRGTKFFAGMNVARGGDDTLYSKRAGMVKFAAKKRTQYNGVKKTMRIVSVQ